METSGRLSVKPKSQNRPLTPKDIQIPTDYEGLCTNVVIDGKVIVEHLTAIRLDTAWLHKELAQQDVTDCSRVLLAYVDSAGMLHIHMKDN